MAIVLVFGECSWGRIFGWEGAGEKKKWLTSNETGIARTKGHEGFEDWMSRKRGKQSSR
jgi:hypothetical protein